MDEAFIEQIAINLFETMEKNPFIVEAGSRVTAQDLDHQIRQYLRNHVCGKAHYYQQVMRSIVKRKMIAQGYRLSEEDVIVEMPVFRREDDESDGKDWVADIRIK